jgi:hypothetical protein
MFADGYEPLAERHVVPVTLAALGFKTANQPIKTCREPQIGGARRTLNSAHTTDQHFEVVHPSKKVLRLFQHRDARHRARTTHLPHQLEPVPQFLDRDSDLVQAIGQVQTRGVVDRGPESYGTPGRAFLCGGDTLRVARRRGPRVRLSDSRDGSPPQLVHVDARNLAAHVGIQPLTLLTQ